MIGVFICAALSLGIFALAALADERWPDRLTRRGSHLLGQPWKGHWGALPKYGTKAPRSHSGAADARLGKPSPAVR